MTGSGLLFSKSNVIVIANELPIITIQIQIVERLKRIVNKTQISRVYYTMGDVYFDDADILRNNSFKFKSVIKFYLIAGALDTAYYTNSITKLSRNFYTIVRRLVASLQFTRGMLLFEIFLYNNFILSVYSKHYIMSIFGANRISISVQINTRSRYTFR